MSHTRYTVLFNTTASRREQRQDSAAALQEEPLNLIYVDTHQSIQASKALQILCKCQPGAE